MSFILAKHVTQCRLSISCFILLIGDTQSKVLVQMSEVTATQECGKYKFNESTILLYWAVSSLLLCLVECCKWYYDEFQAKIKKNYFVVFRR